MDRFDTIQNHVLALRHYAKKLTRDLLESEDLVQHTIFKAVAKYHQFQEGSNLEAWLTTILHNEFVSRMKHKKVVDKFVKYTPKSIETALDDSIDIEIGLYIDDILKSIPETQKRALILVGFQGYSYQEAAEIEDIPLTTLRRRVYFARRKAQAAMQEVTS